MWFESSGEHLEALETVEVERFLCCIESIEVFLDVLAFGLISCFNASLLINIGMLA